MFQIALTTLASWCFNCNTWVTIKNLSYPSHRSLHVWDPAQQCTHHCGVHHLFGLPFALTAWGLGPVSATVTINAVQPRRATRERQRQTLRNASHQAGRGQELQLQNYSQHPLTLHFIHFKSSLKAPDYSLPHLWGNLDVLHINNYWLDRWKLLEIHKGGCYRSENNCFGFDWFTCYTVTELMMSKFVFHFKVPLCESLEMCRFVYFIVALCVEWSTFVYCQYLHCWHIVTLFSIT